MKEFIQSVKSKTFMISISLHLFEQYTGIIMFLTKVGRVKVTYWLLLVITAEVETTCRISRNIYVTALQNHNFPISENNCDWIDKI